MKVVISKETTTHMRDSCDSFNEMDTIAKEVGLFLTNVMDYRKITMNKEGSVVTEGVLHILTEGLMNYALSEIKEILKSLDGEDNFQYIKKLLTEDLDFITDESQRLT